MKPTTTLFRLILALLLAASVGACGTDSSSSSDGASSASDRDGLSLRVTDAPFANVARLDLTFREVHLRKTNGEWIVIPTEELVETTIEIAGLQGARTASLLENVTVPDGDYDELRLIVEDPARMELTAGGFVDLEIPSGSTSGLKIKGQFMITDGLSTDLVVDFDLLRSIKEFGPPAAPRFKMNPVLRLVKGNAFGHARGKVDGNLLTAPGCSVGEHNAVYVYEGHGVAPNDITRRNNDVDPITTSKIFWDGDSYKYEAAFLPPGEYTIAFTCNADDEDLKTDDDLNFFGEMDITIKVNDTLFL